MSNNICVVGAGNWGKNHIRTLNELGLLGGIIESNSEVRSNIENQYPTVSVYQNLEDALQNKAFDGFTVATPVNTHFEIAKKIIPIYLLKKRIYTNLKQKKVLISVY